MKTVDSQLLMRRVLLLHYQKCLETNPRFSLRAYSQKFSIAPGTLSQIMNGKRNATLKFAKMACAQLNLSKDVKEKILNTFKTPAKKKSEEFHTLTLEEFGKINHWVHFAILSLMQTKNFRADSRWIAGRLGTTESEIKTALKNLLQLQIVHYVDGKLTRTGNKVTTLDDKASVKIREAHKASLELAKVAIDEVPLHLRDFTTTTVPINPNAIPVVKEKIRDFYDELEAYIEEYPDKSEVYRLSIEFFPLTKTKKDKSHA